MKAFMDEQFLLSTQTAQKLFHNYAEHMPILDYHCHINPQEIAEDRQFSNITEVWLGGDHYKWRQMRSNGVDEYYITGDDRKPALSLVALRASEIFRIQGPSERGNGRGGLEPVQ